MKKKIISLFISVCLIVISLAQSAFAVESNIDKYDIDEIYDQAYAEAITSTSKIVDSDESAYAYLISHMNDVQQKSDGTIFVKDQDILLSEQEKNIILSFVEKLNNLIKLDAVSVDSNLRLHFVSNPQDTRISTRSPGVSIMGDVRNHAKELKKVFDNAVFTKKHFTAGKYFAERVKSGGIWDYKSFMGTKTRYYIIDMDVTMTGETIGNFHYGYVGRAVFEPATLKSAAGMYQIISGTSSLGYWDSYFDDPSDQSDIDWGIRIYEKEH